MAKTATGKQTQTQASKTTAAPASKKMVKPAADKKADKKAAVANTKKQVAGSKTAMANAKPNANAQAKKGAEPVATKRYFKRLDPVDGKMYGRYTGKTPKQAASKAYTKLRKAMREQKQTIPPQTTIYVRESTRNSARKVYAYQAWIVKLKTPQELSIPDQDGKEDKEIKYRFRNKVKKVALPTQIGGMKIIKSKLQKPMPVPKATTGKATKDAKDAKPAKGAKANVATKGAKTAKSATKGAAPRSGSKTAAVKPALNKPVEKKAGSKGKVAAAPKKATKKTQTADA